MALKKTLDFSNVNDSFELLPAGTYTCNIFDLVEKQSTNGNDMLKITLKINKGDFKGRQIFTNLTFVESALFKVREYLVAVGAKIEKKPTGVDFSKTIGKEIKVVLFHRKNATTDETYCDVKKFLPPTDNSPATTSILPPVAAADEAEVDEVPFK